MFGNTTLPDEAAQPEPRAVAHTNWLRRTFMSSSVVRFCWIANLAALCGLCIWIFSDGLFAEAVRLFPFRAWSFTERIPDLFETAIFESIGGFGRSSTLLRGSVVSEYSWVYSLAMLGNVA